LRNATVCFENGLRGGASEADDNLGRDGINLAQQEWRALLHFVFFRGAIFRGTTLHNVADVNVFSFQPHRFNHLGQELTGAADKRQALQVFVVSGAFADEHEFGFGIAVAEDNFVARGVEFAARAFAEVGSNLEERVVGNLAKGLKERGSRGDRQ